MERSWRAGKAIETEQTDTIADGIAVRMPFPEPVADLVSLVDDFVLVEDEAIVSAMRLAHQHLGVVLEPAGAAGLAAVVTHQDRFKGQLVSTILTGGNITPQQMQEWLGR
jgi:threonine dehydratase